jgi:hypothetical protein
MSLKTTASRGRPTRFPVSSPRSASGRTEGPPARCCEVVPLVLLWPLTSLPSQSLVAPLRGPQAHLGAAHQPSTTRSGQIVSFKST